MKFKLRKLIKHLKNGIGEIILFMAASTGTKCARNKPSCGRGSLEGCKPQNVSERGGWPYVRGGDGHLEFVNQDPHSVRMAAIISGPFRIPPDNVIQMGPERPNQS